MNKNREMMEALGDFLAALSEAQERGEREFTCPLCGGKAFWGRSPGNGHIHAGCDGCGMRIME